MSNVKTVSLKKVGTQAAVQSKQIDDKVDDSKKDQILDNLLTDSKHPHKHEDSLS